MSLIFWDGLTRRRSLGHGGGVELDERTLGEVDQQIVRIQIVETTSVRPEGRDGRFGNSVILREDGQFGEAALLVDGEHVDAGLHGPPEGLVLGIDRLAVGNFVEVRPAQAFQHRTEIAATFLRHASGESQREREQTAFIRDLAGLGRQCCRLDSDGFRQQLQRFRLGEQGHGHPFAVQCLHDSGVPRGDQHPAPRAEEVEFAGIAGPPNVIKDQQDRLGLEQFAEYPLALRERIEGHVSPEMPNEVAEPHKERLGGKCLTERDPDDAVRVGFADPAVAGQGRRQDRLADAPHTLHADVGFGTRVGTGDDVRGLEIDKERIADAAHEFGAGDEMGWQRRDGHESSEPGIRLVEIGDQLRE